MTPDLLALFGLGRRAAAATPDPSVAHRAAAALQSVPIGMWIALVGLLSAIAGPVVAHLLERRRRKE